MQYPLYRYTRAISSFFTIQTYKYIVYNIRQENWTVYSKYLYLFCYLFGHCLVYCIVSFLFHFLSVSTYCPHFPCCIVSGSMVLLMLFLLIFYAFSFCICSSNKRKMWNTNFAFLLFLHFIQFLWMLQVLTFNCSIQAILVESAQWIHWNKLE